MEWPTIAQISALAPLPDGYRYEKLLRKDVPELIKDIGRWHPDIAVGGGSCYLRETFYDGRPSSTMDRNVLVGVFHRADELVGMWSWEQDARLSSSTRA